LTLTGIDVSHHQGAVDWPKVATASYSFAVVKVSQGLGYEDPAWQANTQGAARAGLVVGWYHFLERGDGAGQAARFRSLIGPPAGHLTAVDCETPGTKPDPAYEDVLEFVAEWARRSGGHPLLLYTGRWWWVGRIGDPPAPPGVAGLWNSQYNQLPYRPYGGWAAETVRQYTSAAAVPGVAGDCDCNWFDGTAADLASLTRPEELAMADAQAILDALKQLRQDLVVDGTLGLADSVEKGAGRERQALQKLDALAAKVDAGLTAAQVEALADRLVPLLEARLHIAGMPAYAGKLTGTIDLTPGIVPAAAPQPARGIQG
jgi:GH25 family lysozyme M1 (1,4-beta-N-acetylmuramidase)